MKTLTWVNGSLATQSEEVQSALSDWCPILEVSFPNPRVNALKLVLPEVVLYFRGVSPKFKKAYASLGFSLAELLKDIEPGTVKAIPEILLSADGDYPSIEVGEGQSSFKCMTAGWYKAIPDEIFIDFLSGTPGGEEEEEGSISPEKSGVSLSRRKAGKG